MTLFTDIVVCSKLPGDKLLEPHLPLAEFRTSLKRNAGAHPAQPPLPR
jgi:hypothetical protein